MAGLGLGAVVATCVSAVRTRGGYVWHRRGASCLSLENRTLFFLGNCLCRTPLPFGRAQDGSLHVPMLPRFPLCPRAANALCRSALGVTRDVSGV